MTIKRRIIIAVLIQAVIIGVICIFVYNSFNSVLSKLQTIEIIDDLNISLLEMRKTEKNYFLYRDLGALQELAKLGEERSVIIKSSKPYVVSSLGEETYSNLLTILDKYLALTEEVTKTKAVPLHFEENLRNLGHKLTTLSELLLKQERRIVNRIIYKNVLVLIGALAVIFLFQIILWQYFFRFIIQEITILERMIKMISEGRLHEVAVKSIAPHNEIEIAIKAMSDMAGQLEEREAELLQTGKLASVGVLISGVAHELGNPLNNISMIAQTYLSIYEMLGDEEKQNFMGDVLTQADRIKKIVGNLLDFTRQKKQELQEHYLGEIAQRSLALVSNQIKLSKVKLHTTIPEDLPPVYVDASQIEQVLVNLYINALQAMPEGGQLFIDVSQNPGNDWVAMEIKDTGTGIKKDILPYIFDPFFTTKGTRGTGLGLSVSYGIIRQHRGDISVESEEGKGTTFIIKLPAHHGIKGESDAKENHYD
jgi:two-component system NtrC family sensor kinase